MTPRKQRILMMVDVNVSGRTSGGQEFSEQASTRVLQPGGAVVSLHQRVNNGQKLNLKEITGQSIECTVSEASDLRDGSQQVSLAFNKPYPRFWHVAFPPPRTTWELNTHR